MRSIYLGFKFSLSYFSLLPVKFKRSDNLNQRAIFKYMLFFLPLVGLVISAFTLLFLELGSNWLLYLFGTVFYMTLYGFLHTEAIIDVVDALFAKHSGKDAYKIIKEPTVGAMGLLFGVAFLILKLSSLLYLFLEQKSLFLIAVAISSRVGALAVFRVFEFKSSFLERLKESFSKRDFIIALTLYFGLLFLIFGLDGGYILLVSLIFALLFTRVISSSLGFANGDVVGAVIELVELSTLVFIIALV